MARPYGTYVWNPIPEKLLWEWYWEELLNLSEIAQRWAERPESRGEARSSFPDREHPTSHWVTGWLKKYGIPRRSASQSARLWQRPLGHGRRSDRGYRKVYTEFYDDEINPSDTIHHKDFVPKNDHPLNLQKLTASEHTALHVNRRTGHNESSRPERIPIFEVYMRMAENIALRSHDKRTAVGCVITSFDLRRVLAVGMNGNASGLANEPDSDEPGRSGTIHAEENALIYAQEHGTPRVMFVTVSPCLQCVKLAINAGIAYLYYRESYRDKHPLKIASYTGIMVCRYDKWRNTDWSQR